MIKTQKKLTIESNTYIVNIESLPNLYTKLQIFENSIDITNIIMNNQPLFNKLLGLMSLPKIHHTIPKWMLKNWKDSNNCFNQIVIEKNSSKPVFKTIHSSKKCLNTIFSGLHKYTFNIDNSIVIFEGSFINLVEKSIDVILDYLNLLSNNLHLTKKIKDVIIHFNGKKVNLTEMIVKCITKISINNNIINNINLLNIGIYNRVVSEVYMKCLFHYASIDDHKLFFKNIYDIFSKNIPINGLESTIFIYFSEVSNQTEFQLEEHFGKNYSTGYLKAPSQYKFPISEIWKIQTHNENNKLNFIIPISPDYAILISSDNDTFETFKLRINNDNLFLEIFIENELRIIKDLQYDKFKEDKNGNTIINTKYSILCPDLKTLNIIKTYIENK